MRFKLYGGAALAAFNIFMAGAVLLSWGHELDKYKKMANDKDKLLKIAESDQDYIKARTMYYVSVVNFAAGISDLFVIGTEAAIAAKQWGWALRIGKVIHNRYYVLLGKIGSSALSFVGAIWDVVQAIEYGKQGEVWLATAYGVSAALGFVSGIVIMAVASFPVMLAVMAAYAICTVIVNKLTPDETDVWLKTSYFGQEQKTDSLSYGDWKYEIQRFQKATSLRPAMQIVQ
jgi:hypothetical protein